MSQDDLTSIPNTIHTKKSSSTLRLISFNVNGIKTLRNYHPWTTTPTYNDVLKYMNGDIITFQELKLQRSDIDLGIADLKDYISFITVPVSKKGYSGVGVFIRKPTSTDDYCIKRSLTVVRAEEGITGLLEYKKTGLSYIEASTVEKYKSDCIGGYPKHSIDQDERDKNTMKKIDTEGRCILVELSYDVVIISVYCPANSMGTEEGENGRLLFLSCLFERIRSLKQMGKEVILMGDINVCVDLIDSDETIKCGLNEGLLKKPEDLSNFEKENTKACIEFKSSSEARSLLNSIVFDTTGLVKDKDKDQKLLFDSTREIQGRRMKMYTVWNTFKNTRPLNVGSRIDLILVTEKLMKVVNQADIWAHLHGSDHCPIFTDFEVCDFSSAQDQYSSYKDKTNWLEAKTFYELHTGRSIDSFFTKGSSTKPKSKNTQIKLVNDSTTKRRIDTDPHVSRKKPTNEQQRISNFFFKPTTTKQEVEEVKPTKIKDSVKMSVSDFKSMLQNSSSSAPCCKHKEVCSLRSVKKGSSQNLGKKFWCCARVSKHETWHSDVQPSDADSNSQPQSQDQEVDEFNCGYFKWASKV
ncbi:hypothetical protein CANARDRAFT_6887 [[Candida] arabinofermentans NRRL YB-2248]|uniref:DNA-(apurinic or apyrimidinic site) endonuclease 2 n=1 Tax=[Candida] arabinofermentans NRRL YB-2248 TaxID=983967 RepID=A0A1E4T3W4_9ASCO|nr:hypothetical protein CANARDRAFT_6887 [[Candida] arabinofermentans NRRL YB-2248]